MQENDGTTPNEAKVDETQPVVTKVDETQPVVNPQSSPESTVHIVPKPLIATPAAPIASTSHNSPGLLVLQWLTYAFWGWTVLALAWLTGLDSARVGLANCYEHKLLYRYFRWLWLLRRHDCVLVSSGYRIVCYITGV